MGRLVSDFKSDTSRTPVSDFSRTPAELGLPTGVGVKHVAAVHQARVPAASLLALSLACVAEGASVAIVSNVDTDPPGIRWWLVFAPAFFTALPLLVPRRVVRIAVAGALVLWCVAAAASIGFLFLPATLAALVAARDWSQP